MPSLPADTVPPVGAGGALPAGGAGDAGQPRRQKGWSAGSRRTRKLSGAGCSRSFKAFAAAGGTTIDTSNLYQDGQAETVLGGLLGHQRDDFLIITKYSGTRRTRSGCCPVLPAGRRPAHRQVPAR
nr:aldo/keto reductase [Micromonospora chokoriensis]